jgi:hypothetical protein
MRNINDVVPCRRDTGDENVLHIGPIEPTSAVYDVIGAIEPSDGHAPERHSIERAVCTHNNACEGTLVGIWSV